MTLRASIVGSMARTLRGAALGLLAALACGSAAALDGGGVGEAEVDGGAADGQRFLVSASRCGDRLATEWRRPDGAMVAREEVEFDDGRWVRYRLQRANLRQDLRAERRGEAVTIVDAARPDRAPVRLAERGTLVAGPELVTYLQSRLADLRVGGRLEFRYLLADRGSALGFVARSAQQGGRTVVTLEAASALARPFVPETRLEFGADGALREVRGRMLPVAGDARSQTPLDGVLRMRSAQSSCNIKTVS
jgi:hypothetical protein